MILNFEHKDIEFEFEIERIRIQRNPLADLMMMEFVMENIQEMHHLAVIFKEHMATLDIADGKQVFTYSDDELIVQIPIECLQGLNLDIE